MAATWVDSVRNVASEVFIYLASSKTGNRGFKMCQISNRAEANINS